MHNHIELPDRYVKYIKDHIELALENFYEDWKRAQKEYDALPWYKRWFRDNPFYEITDEQKENELCLSNCAMFFSYSMEEDRILNVKKYFQGYYPNKSLDMDDYGLVRWWAEHDSN